MNTIPCLKKALAVFFILTVYLFSIAAAESGEALYSVFQQPAERVEGQAYLEIRPFSTPVRPSFVAFEPNFPLWQIGLFVKETGGVPMTLDAITFVRFDAEHNVLANVRYEGDELPYSGVSFTALEPGVAQMMTVSQPVDTTTEYGLLFEGTDANGHAIRATTLIPLSQELVKPQIVDAFRAEGEGDALITLTPSANPVYAREHEFFGNGLGWQYDVSIANTTDVPVSLDKMTLIYFNDEGNINFQYDVDGAAIADWIGLDSHVIAPGEAHLLSDICPMQSMQGAGYRFTVSTEDGRAQTVHLFIELSKELEAE